MNQINQIVIVGQPGAGKGLLARSIAEALNWRFIDADLQIERRVGLSLVDVIGYDGLAAYYDTQADILRQLLSQPGVVIATDAGVIGSEVCRKILQQAFVIYLDVSLSVQLQRLSVSNGPLLSGDKLPDLLQQLHQQRDPFNEEVADYRLCSDDNALEEHVDTITELVGLPAASAATRLNLTEDECLFLNRETHEPVRLSQRQAQCLKLMAKGQADKQIADQLCLSTRTVQDHIANIKLLLGCSSSKQLIAIYHG